MKFATAVFVVISALSTHAFSPSSPAAFRPNVSFNTAGACKSTTTELNMGLRSFIRNKIDGSHETTAVQDVTEEDIRALFYLWNDSLATGDSRIVAKRYAEDSVLLPTVSDVPRTNYDLIKNYFDLFLTKKPQGVITDGHIRIGDNWAQDAGIYEFTMGIDGSKVKARYSFIYVYEDGQWKISHHHSSVMPESVAVGQPISEEEVKGLFSLWNNALASLDSTQVANRYSKNAVLLPTVSDIPRTDYALIKDYFDSFLLKKPQGKILESNVIVGTNWAQDAGIYEFTMGADGSTVKGRYSFVYVYEDGQWKIAHHHSSVMPEGITLGKKATKEQVKNLFYLWNDALATGDSDAVAKRYSKNAVLLPTVSDVPRTDYDLIKDYFDSFLKKEPQGTILESNVILGANWAQDAGIYEFTMGADDSKVKARYTFNYVHEDGQWKISHHHSSVMPEAFLGPAPKPAVKETVEA